MGDSDDTREPTPFAVDAMGPTIPPLTLPSRDASSADLSGTTLGGRYRLERLLGKGGMGAVYKADHLSLGVKVAVKVMHASFGASVDAERRFAREAHAASLLSHKNVVRVLDYGRAEELHYIVMELLVGESLADWLRRRSVPPPLADVLDIVTQIADALDAAHSSGVVHRDLKPENVFLAEESGGGRVVKVVDFGLAFVDEEDPTGTLTRPDAVAGTPHYMSPEQCRSLHVGTSTDLYALGCLLTDLLQLAPPFSSGAPVEIIARQMFAPPPPLDRPGDAEAVPPLLERLRLELLAKQPEQRPSTAAEVHERLAIAFDPARAEALLPGRSGPSIRPGSKQSEPPGHARQGGSRSIAMSTTPGATKPSDDFSTGLHAAGYEITTDADTEILVAEDVRAARAWLAARTILTRPVLVILERASAADLGALVAAGAADVLFGAPRPETAVKRLDRLTRPRSASPK
ncbi:MAG TPA: serine/threonine-protein kinase [Polyangiaceae bacterium]|nr:serine/threonine-protein kinase [Polyangiaceae bacterium]